MTESEWEEFVEMVLNEERRIDSSNVPRLEKNTKKMRLVNIADKVKRALAKD